MRRKGKLWLIAPFLCVWAMAANADDGEATSLIAECNAADLPQASLDSCLERVRVLEETDPSPQLQMLEATLEQRQSGRRVQTRTPAAIPPPVVEVVPERHVADAEKSEQDQLSPSAQPDGSAPRSSAEFEDEPPVSDPPDDPADRADGDQNDPPQS